MFPFCVCPGACFSRVISLLTFSRPDFHAQEPSFSHEIFALFMGSIKMFVRGVMNHFTSFFIKQASQIYLFHLRPSVSLFHWKLKTKSLRELYFLYHCFPNSKHSAWPMAGVQWLFTEWVNEWKWTLEIFFPLSNPKFLKLGVLFKLVFMKLHIDYIPLHLPREI